ncbi:MAG: nucleotidyltransferase domain-containing protein [Ignavibacteriales bacterium]|nr:nucleotidyltransferase domain-containing protein [Ignavibacteriales bacterium]
MMDNSVKEEIKSQIIETFQQDKEIEKVVLWGSFLSSDEPNDIDLAIFQNSNKNYLSLALKYRKLLRVIAVQIPITLIPIVSSGSNDYLMNEINDGLVLSER